MVQCKKCKLYLSTAKDDIIKCKGGCDAVFHRKCARNKSFIENEICTDCQKNEKSMKSDLPKLNVDLGKTTPEALLAEVNLKLEMIFNIQKTLEDLAEAVDFYAEKYQDLVEYKQIQEKKMIAMEHKTVYLEKCNRALEERISGLELKQMEKNVEIVGLVKGEGEDLMKIGKNIAKKLNLNPGKISEIMRVGKEKATDTAASAARPRPPRIIITLDSRATRDEWILQRKMRLTNGDVYQNDDKSPVYINEDIPKQTRQLLWEAKAELKNIYRYIWIRNGKIYVRQEGAEKKKIIIRSIEDIEKLKANNKK